LDKIKGELPLQPRSEKGLNNKPNNLSKKMLILRKKSLADWKH
jgi:hypothetical protein